MELWPASSSPLSPPSLIQLLLRPRERESTTTTKHVATRNLLKVCSRHFSLFLGEVLPSKIVEAVHWVQANRTQRETSCLSAAPAYCNLFYFSCPSVSLLAIVMLSFLIHTMIHAMHRTILKDPHIQTLLINGSACWARLGDILFSAIPVQQLQGIL